MRFIRIFLASSIVELEHDRDALGNFVRKLNDSLVDRQIPAYIRLFACELEDETLRRSSRKQEQYNGEIMRSDLFLNLYFNKAGQFTLEELDTAEEALARQGKPEILVFTRMADCGAFPFAPEPSLAQLPGHLGETPVRPYEDIAAVKAAVLDFLRKQGLEIS